MKCRCTDLGRNQSNCKSDCSSILVDAQNLVLHYLASYTSVIFPPVGTVTT